MPIFPNKIDSNANSAQRHRRNWQRAAKGALQSAIKVIFPFLNTTNGLSLAIEPAGGLGTTTNGLSIMLASPSGLILSTNGLSFNPTSAGGLQISTNGASIKNDPSGGLTSGTNGEAIKLASPSGLILSTNGLAIQLGGTNSALALSGTGIAVQVDGSTIKVNTSNQLEAVNGGSVTSVGATISPTNVATVTGSPITNTGSFAFVINQSSATSSGYLSSTDWSTFNAKGTGTVSSVALSLPGIFAVTGSPVTNTGTLSATFVTQTANTFFGGPTSGTGIPAFRAIVDGDIPGTIVRTSRTISTTSPLTGGGDLSANRTLAIPQASGTQNGYLDSGDWLTFNNKSPLPTAFDASITITPTAQVSVNPASAGGLQTTTNGLGIKAVTSGGLTLTTSGVSVTTVQNLSADPSTSSANGTMWFNTTTGKLKAEIAGEQMSFMYSPAVVPTNIAYTDNASHNIDVQTFPANFWTTKRVLKLRTYGNVNLVTTDQFTPQISISDGTNTVTISPGVNLPTGLNATFYLDCFLNTPQVGTSGAMAIFVVFYPPASGNATTPIVETVAGTLDTTVPTTLTVSASQLVAMGNQWTTILIWYEVI